MALTPVTPVSKARFAQAQAAELAYWAAHATDEDYIRYELVEHSEVAGPLRRLCGDRVFAAGLEVGVGPYGLGLMAVHFRDRIRRIDGLDPLRRLDVKIADLALRDGVEAVRRDVNYMRATGELIPVAARTYDIVACVNVVDHAQHPYQIVAEIHRVLKPGGIFVFGVNALSVVGELRWRLGRGVRPKEWLLVAHPHTFSWSRADRMLRGTMRGSRVLWRNKPGMWRRAAGHGRMSFWIVEKGARPWS